MSHVPQQCMCHVVSKMLSCRMSNLRNYLRHVTISLAIYISPMSDVDFKKSSCRRFEFRGQGP